MAKLTAGIVARAYLIVVLVLAALVSTPFQLGLALGLLVIQLYSVYARPRSGLNLVLVVATLIFAPLALEGLVGAYAVLVIVPAIYLLDESLKEVAVTQVFSFRRVGRSASQVLKTLVGGLLLVLAVSVVAWNLTLVLAVAVLMVYVGCMVAYVLRKVPRYALVEDKSWSRIVAGDQERRKFKVEVKTDRPLLVALEPTNSWVKIDPAKAASTAKSDLEVTVAFTPPLAGPTNIQLKAAYFDIRGLIETNQVLKPLDLHIIPRAKYAQWLANKFLEQTSSGNGLLLAAGSNSKGAKGGVEYYGNRPYQVGDKERDIDWRHSYMLGDLIVKEFSGAQGETGLIVADLTAKNLEDADKLAYNLVMSALTLATEGLPSALAVYNKTEVIAVTKPNDSRETLKAALEATAKITVIEPKQKVLHPIESVRLKRSIGQLAEAKGGVARRLSEVIMFELDAKKEASKSYPASLALGKATRNAQEPMVITVVSQLSDDSDSLLLILEQLKQKGYSILFLGD
jgi:uncharacterized protein (DUF58 family)